MDNNIYSLVQPKRDFDRELWNEIMIDLGELSGFEIVNNELHFKSKGQLKVIPLSNDYYTFLIASSYYVSEQTSPLKKYKQGDANGQ